MTRPGRFAQGRRAALASAVALALLTLTAAARPAQAGDTPSQRLTLAASLGGFYDSNILEYSGDQITLFEGGTRPDRYSLKSTDDMVWNPSLALGWEQAGANGRRHMLRLKTEGDFHQKNGTADFHSVSVYGRESWSHDRRLSASWYTLPQFYLRQLIAEDYVPPFPGMSRYHRAFFSLGIGSLDWSQRIGRANSLALGGQFEHRGYNPDFRERDSDTWQGEGAWGWTRLPHHGEFELRGLYRVSHAKAADGDEAPAILPDDADISYHGAGGGVHGDMELARGSGWRLTTDADYQLAARDYDSDRTADRYHFGRRDLLHTAELGMALRWKRDWRARTFWHVDRNLARLGASAPASTDAGEYSRSQVGLRLEWSGTLWRSHDASAGGE